MTRLFCIGDVPSSKKKDSMASTCAAVRHTLESLRPVAPVVAVAHTVGSRCDRADTCPYGLRTNVVLFTTAAPQRVPRFGEAQTAAG